MRIIIAGSRNFSDIYFLEEKCDEAIAFLEPEEVEIVSGGARGADKLGEQYALDNGYKIRQFIPDWEKHGKSAGYLRNKEMAEYGDTLIAFWDGKSKGTGHMINLAREANLSVFVHYYDERT